MSDSSARLDGWKAIAEYLGCDISTAQRWERERALPVRRVPGGRGQSVFALAAEVDRWLSVASSLEGQREVLAVLQTLPVSRVRAEPRRRLVVAALMTLVATLILVALVYETHRSKPGMAPPRSNSADNGTPHLSFDFAVFDAASPSFVAVADFNRDGIPDIAASSAGAGIVTILLGQGQRRFAEGVVYSSCRGSLAPIASDLDMDGNLDLIIPCMNDTRIVVLWGDGRGGFSQAQSIDLGQSTRSIAVGDLNGDGIPDIVAVSPNGGLYSIRNLGHRRFKVVQQLKEAIGASQAILIDLDKNGKLDVIATITAEGRGHSILMARGDGTGQFHSKQTLTRFDGPYSIRALNSNESGEIQIAVLDFGGGRLSVLHQTEPFHFAPLADLIVGKDAIMDVGDLNGDGQSDIAVVQRQEQEILVLIALGNGKFSSPQVINGPGNLGQLMIADVDGDGVPDLVTPMPYSSQVWIGFNRSVAPSKSK